MSKKLLIILYVCCDYVYAELSQLEEQVLKYSVARIVDSSLSDDRLNTYYFSFLKLLEKSDDVELKRSYVLRNLTHFIELHIQELETAKKMSDDDYKKLYKLCDDSIELLLRLDPYHKEDPSYFLKGIKLRLSKLKK